jgi:hypothetical protein
MTKNSFASAGDTCRLALPSSGTSCADVPRLHSACRNDGWWRSLSLTAASPPHCNLEVEKHVKHSLIPKFWYDNFYDNT